MLANEALLPGSHRARSGRPECVIPSDSSRINVGGVNAAGVDFAVKADFLTDAQGASRPSCRHTWFDRLDSTDVPGQAPVERVNLASESAPFSTGAPFCR